VTESSPSVQICRLSVVRHVQRSVASRSQHNSTHQSAEPSNAHNLYNPPLSFVNLQTCGLIPRYMESCSAQTTPNLLIHSQTIKEHPRHNFSWQEFYVSLQSKHRTPPFPSSEFSQQPMVAQSSRNPSSASTLEVFPLLLSNLPSRYRVETFCTPAESTPTGRSTTTPNWNCGDPAVFKLRVQQNHQNPPLSPTSTRNLPHPSRVRSKNPSDNCYPMKPWRLDCFSVQHPQKHRHCPRTRAHQTSESIESTN
jgi:hypothetical protein